MAASRIANARMNHATPTIPANVMKHVGRLRFGPHSRETGLCLRPLRGHPRREPYGAAIPTLYPNCRLGMRPFRSGHPGIPHPSCRSRAAEGSRGGERRRIRRGALPIRPARRFGPKSRSAPSGTASAQETDAAPAAGIRLSGIRSHRLSASSPAPRRMTPASAFWMLPAF